MTKLAQELRECDEEELENRLLNARKELFNLRFQVATGRLDNVARIGQVRKQVACILTVQRDREITAAEALEADTAPPSAEPRPARRARKVGAADAAAASPAGENTAGEPGAPSTAETLMSEPGGEAISAVDDTELADDKADDAAEPAVVPETAAGPAGAAASTVHDADAEEESDD
jgi:large subunit ribosomal protein L29